MTERLSQTIADVTYISSVTALAGCPDVAISHGLFILDGAGGFGVAASRIRENQIRAKGYSAVLCTVHEENEKEKAILSKNGWSCLCTFFNKRTKHNVQIWIKSL